MSPRISELCLELRLPRVEHGPIEYQTRTGQVWETLPGKPDQKWCTAEIWKRIDNDWFNRDGILNEARAALGAWLFDPRAVQYVQEQIEHWEDHQPRLRFELRIPASLSDYPWELAGLAGLGSLAVHNALTVVRVSDKGNQQFPPSADQLVVHVVGVMLDPEAGWPVLETSQEVETVRLVIENAAGHGFTVEVLPQGDWHALVQHYEKVGPPHVFHFAGHGLESGHGLLFRGKDGKSEKVTAEKVAAILTHRTKSRQTRLAFLNACATSGGKRGPFQPFGGVGELLVQGGIPMVVGLQAPVGDREAQALAETFYTAVSHGDAVDCAVQEARRKLFLLWNRGVGWAFVTLHVSGQPVPLCPMYERGSAASSLNLMDFGHEVQRQRLQRFLSRKRPMVIIVHGEEKSGQRHVLTRVQSDLEREGNVLWRPVAALRLHLQGDPLLRRSQLAGGIARAFSVPDTGTQHDLEERLAQTIAERCTNDHVLVIDLQEVLIFQNQEHARSLLTLVQDLWAELMRRAAAYRSTLPVFFLVSVAYPRLLPESHPRAQKVADIIAMTEQTVQQLADKSQLAGNVRVMVLPKLEPFGEDYVANYLEEVLELTPAQAESKAANLVGTYDNETILERMRYFLSDM